MSDTDGYNGWTNRETWLVSLWLDNDEFNYTEVRQLAKDAQELPYPAVRLALTLEAYVDDLPEVSAVTEGPASFVVDMLTTSLGQVDWHEIAESILSE